MCVCVCVCGSNTVLRELLGLILILIFLFLFLLLSFLQGKARQQAGFLFTYFCCPLASILLMYKRKEKIHMKFKCVILK